MSLPNVAYFSMEMAIDQSLHIYSGGLGFLSGSHMLSAGFMKLPMVGVTVLWSAGYGEQVIDENEEVQIEYQKRDYPFLKDTGIIVDVTIFGETVKVKAFLLEPEVFGTVPIYLLTTDIPENTEQQRLLTFKLYDGEQRIRISQEIILGIGGMRVLKAAKTPIDVIHLNEGHALPAAFELLADYGGNLDQVRHHTVFTTHTPVAAGNESHPAYLLYEAGFFVNTSLDQAIQLGGEEFSLTVAALRMSRMSNGVSQLHGMVANNMWSWVHERCPIVAITNAVNERYWQDPRLKTADTTDKMIQTKRTMKQELFDYVKQQTGKDLDPDVLTVVWARRFTEYKRAWLISMDQERLEKLLKTNKIQLIYAGKFHPNDTSGRQMFNNAIKYAKTSDKVAVLPNYELEMSGLLKRGADIWLNTPLRPLEASGTSGMSANLNGALHVSIFDGWAVEGTYHGLNGFIINEAGKDEYLPVEDRHKQDHEALMKLLENELIPTYYENKERWVDLMRNAILVSESYFHSDRMAVEYFNRLYKPIYL
ncbi:MAG: alpha-glucan family phosphorylase [Cyanobacteria bacterium]|nr:alpha-glucan family phosphorylase [Cyanobacteriota bacterium]